MKRLQFFALLVITVLSFATTFAQTADPRYYDMGAPTLTELWVDPVNGSDANSGESREQALLTVEAAWQRIPMGETMTTTGYHMMLAPGVYPQESVPLYFESRYGTYEFPVIVQAADGPGTVILPSLNIFEGRYFYLIGLNIEAGGGDILHCERCDHFLIRGVRVMGAEPDTFNVQETLKVNQSQYVYVEDSDISGAWDNAVDFVAVQYGTFQGNHIHNAGDWCMYLKGGSAYFRVEGNEYYDCGTGGFTVGQGTGFQFMVAPWIQYEGYDIQFINNLIHDTLGAGLGVQGGYNVLMAYNTLYRVGETSHALVRRSARRPRTRGLRQLPTGGRVGQFAGERWRQLRAHSQPERHHPQQSAL